jgi:hypothetical protein
MRKPPSRFGPRIIQRTFKYYQIEPLINRISWQLRIRNSLNRRRERERSLEFTDAVATRHHRGETEREVNPFPLIEVTVQLSERGKRIRQAFEVGRLFGLAFLYVLVGLIHEEPMNSAWVARFYPVWPCLSIYKITAIIIYIQPDGLLGRGLLFPYHLYSSGAERCDFRCEREWRCSRHSAPSTVETVSASVTLNFSRLNISPHTIAVYASWPPSPTGSRNTRYRAGATPYPGRTFTGWIRSIRPDAPPQVCVLP